ncbi:MAG: cob(I)yrinic acid a,c-diamide adenosyltransferase [Sideroxydans sp.]
MRLSKITTRSGDDGCSALADGKRLPKHHAHFAALGSMDELNCLLGLLLAETLPARVRADLTQVQNDLFDLGSCLAVPGREFPVSYLARLDEWVARDNAALPPLAEFILPGGCRAAALCHLARAVTRRAERDYARLLETAAVSRDGLRYLNRLSDWLFVLSRVLNRTAGTAESQWQPGAGQA